MNKIEELRDRIAGEFKDVEHKMDAPDNPSKTWWLDFYRRGTLVVTIEWRPTLGFGISNKRRRGGYFRGGPDEVYREIDFEQMMSRLHQLLIISVASQ